MHTRNMKVSDLIAELQAILSNCGDLPVGGDDADGVAVTVCDSVGRDAFAYASQPHSVFLEAR